MLKHLIGMSSVRFSEAVCILEHVSLLAGMSTLLLAQILPHVTTTFDVAKLLNLYVAGDYSKLQILEKYFGKNTLRVIKGQIDGYFSLQLSKPVDQLCLSLLLKRSVSFDICLVWCLVITVNQMKRRKFVLSISTQFLVLADWSLISVAV